jgi:hypothetical protein
VVINQVNKSWDRNKENMDAYRLEVRKLENKFYGLEFHHVVRDNNVAADVRSKLGSTRAQVPAGVFVHELHAPSIPELVPPTIVPAHSPVGQEVMMIDVDWRQPFIDKFTKWIEVKPVTCPKADRVLDFLDELVHRYGLPHRIITDLGSNFNNHQFWEYCENRGIDVRYVSVAHPRANGQVERANGMVLDALKKRLHDAANTKGGKWIKELPNAL